jgi:hypothetical protein
LEALRSVVVAFANFPIMPAPIVPPGMDLEESNVAVITACTIVLFILGSIGVGLRFWARRKTKQNLWWDDYLVIFAWV